MSFTCSSLPRPAASDGGGGGDSPARRPGADGRCASPVVLPHTSPPPTANASYVDHPQAAMRSHHRPGTAPGPAGDRPSPFAPLPAI